MQIAVVLVLLGAVGVLLATERLREDLVAMLALSALVVLKVVTPAQALSGFSNPATVAVACMFLLSAGEGTLVCRHAKHVLPFRAIPYSTFTGTP